MKYRLKERAFILSNISLKEEMLVSHKSKLSSRKDLHICIVNSFYNEEAYAMDLMKAQIIAAGLKKLGIGSIDIRKTINA